MTRRRGGLVGRRAELDAVLEAGGAGPVLVSGPAGSGKTALLREARRVLAARGTPVLDVPVPADGPAWDRFGFRAVLGAVREQYECFDADPRLPDALDEVSRLCTEDGYADPWTRFCLLHAMSTLFTRLSATAPVTVVFDDVDRLDEPALAAAPVHRAGHAVLASATAPLGPAFPRVVELGPLLPDEAASLVRRQGKAPVTPAAETAVRQALGPLWGNPGAVVSTIAGLRERGQWETVDGFARLTGPARPITLPAAHPAFAVLAPFGEVGRRIVLLASEPGGLAAEDLRYAAAPGARAGQAVDALVAAGLLECDPAGTLRCRVPAFAAAVAEAAGSGARQRLHREIVARLLETGPREDVLARQLAAAGPAVPRRPEFAELLRTAASALSPGSPLRTGHLRAAWWHTASGAGRIARQAELVRHLVREADYPAMAEFVAEAVQDGSDEGERVAGAVPGGGEQVRGGFEGAHDGPVAVGRAAFALEPEAAQDGLGDGEQVARALGAPASRAVAVAVGRAAFAVEPEAEAAQDWRAGLALAAVLAAVHTGQPVAAGVRAELGRSGAAREVLLPADRWFAGERVEPADVVAALLPVWQRFGVPAPPGRAAWSGRRHGAPLADACAVRDLVPVLAAVLGEDYRVPAAGPLAAYHRVRTAYAEGRWTETLAAVEELESYQAVDELAREHARLLAAEVCGWRGETARAAGWLARVPEHGHFPHLKAWVQAGLCHHAQEPEQAFEVGRRAFRAHPFSRDELGASRLLLRLAWLAGRVEDTGPARVVVGVAENYHENRNSARSFGVLAAVRGLAAGDETEIRTAERLVRRRGDHELVLLSEPAVRRPRGWLREAYENTRAGGAARTAREPEPATATATGRAAALSVTEREILQLIRTGQTNRQIARTIRMSEKTVEKHLSRLFAKAGCRTRYGLATSGLGRHPDAIGA
ncbi:AAA family ATPase [Amycolatopsis sp. A133]|uniref:helix-turn-helix transcriptional regulator n=1 Tax=Amycolatopsis sp. A133 TaxID=3064472 RepID=UPI0027E6DA5C|nr:AAA family ATPase [Amycolatopsis sp. A133]MDQ7810890.1 AAA family ATPase [Amycolatopsis sp. A133]